jgi:hypothetical protein
MKYKLLYCTWLIFAILITSGCNDNGNTSSSSAATPDSPDSSLNQLAAPPPKTWKQIDSCYARRLFINFDSLVREPFEAAHPDIGIPGNIWYDSALITSLADRIRVNQFSGVRIYFGAYQTSMGVRTNTRYALSPTIFIVETKRINGKHIDQFGIKCPDNLNTDAYNHGHLCPPDPAEQCKGAAFDERNIP